MKEPSLLEFPAHRSANFFILVQAIRVMSHVTPPAFDSFLSVIPSSNKKAPVASRGVLPDDIAFLTQFGIGLPHLYQAMDDCTELECSPANALMLNGSISEANYFKCVAEFLQVPFAEFSPSSTVRPGRILDAESIERSAHIVMSDEIGPLANIFIAPDCRKLSEIRALLDRRPELRQRIRITTRSSNRSAIIDSSSKNRLRKAIYDLKDRYPTFSAHIAITSRQQFVFLTVLGFLGVLFYSVPSIAVISLHIIFSVFHLSCVGLRLAAAVTLRPQERQPDLIVPEIPAIQFPTYSILVALYQEKSQVRDLVHSLSQIQWPHSKLEIKLICEADDLETIRAVEDAINGPPFELVRVPASAPRTKPKALNYALPLCKGRFLVLYDAEDRPDPLQLQEAWKTFEETGPKVACLQAPLVIDNANRGWIAGMFAFEYAALFDGLLPILEKWGALLPLGGTSNHFRRKALEIAGGWDAHNVTEDADLGVRLARLGYITKTLRRPTYEEAPTTFSVWIKQRTRWFKGWLQTWLVHQRKPIKLFRDLGLKNFIIFHLLISGMLFAALTHIFFLISLAIVTTLFALDPTSQFNLTWLFGIDFVNVILGYVGFAILGWRTVPIRNLSRLRLAVLGIPLYWLFISMGAWRAIWHFANDPFGWEKTPHGQSERVKKNNSD